MTFKLLSCSQREHKADDHGAVSESDALRLAGLVNVSRKPLGHAELRHKSFIEILFSGSRHRRPLMRSRRLSWLMTKSTPRLGKSERPAPSVQPFSKVVGRRSRFSRKYPVYLTSERVMTSVVTSSSIEEADVVDALGNCSGLICIKRRLWGHHWGSWDLTARILNATLAAEFIGTRRAKSFVMLTSDDDCDGIVFLAPSIERY